MRIITHFIHTIHSFRRLKKVSKVAVGKNVLFIFIIKLLQFKSYRADEFGIRVVGNPLQLVGAPCPQFVSCGRKLGGEVWVTVYNEPKWSTSTHRRAAPKSMVAVIYCRRSVAIDTFIRLKVCTANRYVIRLYTQKNVCLSSVAFTMIKCY